MGVEFSFDSDSLMRDLLDKAKGMAHERAKQIVMETLGPVDFGKLRITFEDRGDKDGQICISGPDDLVAKANDAIRKHLGS